MAPQLPGSEPVDYGRVMGTVVTELQALVALQREVHHDFVAALDVVKNYSPSRTTARRARTGIKALAGGADASAGQTTSSSPDASSGVLRPVDPAAGQLSGPTPRTVEDARGAAFGAQIRQLGRQLGSTVSGFPPSAFPGARALHFLAGTTARASTASSPSPAGGGSGGGGVPYVPGYGFYGGQGTPYLIGHGGMPVMPGGGGGGGHGGIRPSGSGSGGHGSHLGLLGAIGSRVPVVGLAVRGVEEALSQREKNAFYQNVEGGSNAGGFGERLSEEAYRWSTPGMFTSAEARQAFKGVTKIGYNGRVESGHGPGRQQALNFVYHGKSSYGATVDESLATLQEASKSTLTPLNDLSKALKDLSDDAGKAGTNAQMARSQMMSLFAQATAANYGSGATSAASTISDTMASYGRSYADSSPAGQLTPGFGRYAAAQAGLTYGQYVSLQKTSPQQAANVRTGVGLQAIAQVLTPQMQQFIREQIAQYGGKVDESTSLQIASAFLSKFGRQIDPDVLTHQLSALSGIQFSDYDHALGWVALQMAGRTEASRANTAKPSDFTGTGLVSATQAQAWGLADPGFDAFTKSPATNKGIYPGGGKVDPVMAALAAKVGNTKQQYVTVHTSAGPQVMRLDEAMATHPNELAAGQVQFVGTRGMVKDPKTGMYGGMGLVRDSYSGQSVSQVLGGQIDTSRSWSSEAQSAPTSGTPASQVPLVAQLAATGASAAATSKVTIDLTADARKLLTVVGATGTAGAAGEAAPPANPFALNPSLSR
jgi:hypothetical protein